MIYPTLKKNKENGIDIIEYVECLVTCVGTLFGNESYRDNKYVDRDDTNWEKLFEDYTIPEIERRCWNIVKEDFKYATKGDMFRYGDYVFDLLDCGDYVYKDVEMLDKEGKLKRSDIFKIKSGVAKKGYSVGIDERYGENDIYCRHLTLTDLANKYFPCTADETGCTNCCNCD